MSCNSHFGKASGNLTRAYLHCLPHPQLPSPAQDPLP